MFVDTVLGPGLALWHFRGSLPQPIELANRRFQLKGALVDEHRTSMAWLAVPTYRSPMGSDRRAYAPRVEPGLPLHAIERTNTGGHDRTERSLANARIAVQPDRACCADLARDSPVDKEEHAQMVWTSPPSLATPALISTGTATRCASAIRNTAFSPPEPAPLAGSPWPGVEHG